MVLATSGPIFPNPAAPRTRWPTLVAAPPPAGKIDGRRLAKLVERVRRSPKSASFYLNEEAEALSPRAYSRVLKGFRDRKAWRATLSTIAHLKAREELNSIHATLGFSTCAACQNAMAAIELLDILGLPHGRGASLDVDLRCLTQAIVALGSAPPRTQLPAPAASAALRVLHDFIPGTGLQPDAFSYEAALSALSRAGDGSSALSVFREMRRVTLPAITPLPP